MCTCKNADEVSKGMSAENGFPREFVIVLVLAVLKDAKTYGHEIMREVDRRSDQELKMGRMTVYMVLRDLEHDGYIAGSWEPGTKDRQRRVYELTPSGLAEYERRCTKWVRFARAMYRVVGEVADGRSA